MYTHLRHQIKGYYSRKSSHSSRGKIKNRVSIYDRPSDVETKERIGDCKIHLIIGKEFAFHEQITEALSAQVYFADP